MPSVSKQVKRRKEIFSPIFAIFSVTRAATVCPSNSEADNVSKSAGLIAATCFAIPFSTQVPSAELQHEKEVLTEQARNEGKPEKIIEKMVEGRIEKYYKETRAATVCPSNSEADNVSKSAGLVAATC